ncbi:ArnT family glycosyltransferase [Butyrivibrio sp. AE2032]|uniref:ArnT family glycosyltransferase n=1 Tax=Butyrivibrio sp. AE2032 TaxID=1458463 RepID=UPI000554393F|nr:glycosyltransferase family 39 protein [Butyrivibrio sp. AE2032]
MSDIKRRYNLCKIDYILCFVATVFGGVFRFLGYNWGTDTMLHQVDEGRMVDPVITMVENKSLFYDSFAYPAHCFSKLQTLIVVIYRHILGGESYNFLVKEYLICRLVTALAGTLTIILIFLIGNAIYKHVGTVSACVLAVSPIMIMMSKQVTGDVTTLFFSAIIMLLALCYIENKKIKYIVLMAIVAAMATMEKWHAGADGVFIGIIILVFAKSIGEFIKRGVIAFFTYIASIIVIAPDITWNLKGAIDDFFYIAVWDAGQKPGYFTNLKAYFVNSYMGLGIIFIILSILGLFYVLVSKEKKFLVLLICVTKLGILCVMNRTFLRWALELFFVQSILVSYAICKLFEYKTVGKVLSVITTCIIIIEMTLATVFVDAVAVARDQDVRFLQEEFCKENGITINNAVSGRYTAFNTAVRIDPSYLFASDDGSDVFRFIDGKLYKIQDVDYYVWSGRSYNETDDILEYLDRNNSCIWDKKLDYRDVANMPYQRESMTTKNDIILCKEYLKAIGDMMNGAIIGTFDIKIYNISDLPYYDSGEE